MFLPFAYIIGVDPEDVKEVSSVVGMKLVTSEFLAFMELGKLRNSNQISVSIGLYEIYLYYCR